MNKPDRPARPAVWPPFSSTCLGFRLAGDGPERQWDQRRSGRRRRVPVPLRARPQNGDETAAFAGPCAASPASAIARRSTIWKPARASRPAAWLRRRGAVSQARIRPGSASRPPSPGSCPGPGAQVRTRMPGRASVSAATSCDPSSCNSPPRLEGGGGARPGGGPKAPKPAATTGPVRPGCRPRPGPRRPARRTGLRVDPEVGGRLLQQGGGSGSASAWNTSARPR